VGRVSVIYSLKKLSSGKNRGGCGRQGVRKGVKEEQRPTNETANLNLKGGRWGGKKRARLSQDRVREDSGETKQRRDHFPTPRHGVKPTCSKKAIARIEDKSQGKEKNAVIFPLGGFDVEELRMGKKGEGRKNRRELCNLFRGETVQKKNQRTS